MTPRAQISTWRPETVLRTVRRRYRVPAILAAGAQPHRESPSAMLAVAIERVREDLAAGEIPGEALKAAFLEALARLIQEAMRTARGDPAFQATVLRHQSTWVREYASLAAHAERDRREIRAAVNAIAHPAKLQRMPDGPLRDMLSKLHDAAAAAAWRDLADVARHTDLAGLRVQQLRDSSALTRLLRLDVLASNELVQHYQTLWARQGPRAGSDTAMKLGSASRQRGAAVESLAAQALQALADRLNATPADAALYRVVTSMRASPSLPASAEYAKSEWDAVLLRQAGETDGSPVFDLCLLIEAKASVDAATTDLPRLLRGLRLLSSAQPDVTYSFATEQGTMRIRGSSLSTLTAEAAQVADHVLYCCDAPAEAAPRLLSATSRMQLLSAEGSVTYAIDFDEKSQRSSMASDAKLPDIHLLEPVWDALLHSPRWEPVRQQYPMLRQVRDLMVHIDDLWVSVNQIATDITTMPSSCTTPRR